MSKDIKKIIALICVAFPIIIVMGFLITDALYGKNGSLDFRKPEEPAVIETITAEDVEAEYEEREVFPTALASTLDISIFNYLSKGDFRGLDEWLHELETTYKNNPSSGINHSSLISQYRRDLAVILTADQYDEQLIATEMSNFAQPDTLAAASMYASASLRMLSCINKDSIIMPKLQPEASSDIQLAKMQLSVDDQVKLLSTINLERTDAGKFVGVNQYTYNAYGTPWLMTIVCTSDYTYALHTIEPLFSENVPSSPLTASLILGIHNAFPEIQINGFVSNNFEKSLTTPEMFADLLTPIIPEMPEVPETSEATESTEYEAGEVDHSLSYEELLATLSPEELELLEQLS